MPTFRDAGFSLAEVLIAVGLLGVAGITVVGLMTVLFDSTVQAREDVQAHATAVAVMESLLTHTYDELPVGSSSGTDPTGVPWTAQIGSKASRLRVIEVVADDGLGYAELSTLISDRF